MPIELGARRNSIEKIINTDIEIFKRIAGDFWIVYINRNYRILN